MTCEAWWTGRVCERPVHPESEEYGVRLCGIHLRAWQAVRERHKRLNASRIRNTMIRQDVDDDREEPF